MTAIASLIVTLLTQLLPLLASMTSGQTQSIITLLEQVLPTIVSEATSLVAPVQNIIAQMQGSGVVTPDQVTALVALNAQCDAAFNAATIAAGEPAATDDNMTAAAAPATPAT